MQSKFTVITIKKIFSITLEGEEEEFPLIAFIFLEYR